MLIVNSDSCSNFGMQVFIAFLFIFGHTYLKLLMFSSVIKLHTMYGNTVKRLWSLIWDESIISSEVFSVKLSTSDVLVRQFCVKLWMKKYDTIVPSSQRNADGLRSMDSDLLDGLAILWVLSMHTTPISSIKGFSQGTDVQWIDNRLWTTIVVHGNVLSDREFFAMRYILNFVAKRFESASQRS